MPGPHPHQVVAVLPGHFLPVRLGSGKMFTNSFFLHHCQRRTAPCWREQMRQIGTARDKDRCPLLHAYTGFCGLPGSINAASGTWPDFLFPGPSGHPAEIRWQQFLRDHYLVHRSVILPVHPILGSIWFPLKSLAHRIQPFLLWLPVWLAPSNPLFKNQMDAGPRNSQRITNFPAILVVVFFWVTDYPMVQQFLLPPCFSVFFGHVIEVEIVLAPSLSC